MGHITLGMKPAGQRSAGKPHAPLDEAGTGNGGDGPLGRDTHLKGEKQPGPARPKHPPRQSSTLLKFVNREIRGGSYFFGDILREGVMLYNAGALTLATPKEATPTERVERAERNFSYWFESAQRFLEGFEFYREKEHNAQAAFLLHQATERLYVTAGLVFIGYKRKQHDLRKLDEEVAPLHPDLSGALPRTEPEDEHLFDLLRRGYIDARYVKSYRITSEELAALGERVRRFAAVVERVCREKIESLRAAANAARTE